MARTERQVIGGAALLALVLGSIHAFSVFLDPLEARFDASRAEVSLTYSLALVSLTIAVLFGHHVFRRMRPAPLAAAICALAALGALGAALSPGLAGVWVCYSLIFGGANGLGYAFGLHLAAQASPGREGLAMGIVTAAYAIGATLSPLLFATLEARYGFRARWPGLPWRFLPWPRSWPRSFEPRPSGSPPPRPRARRPGRMDEGCPSSGSDTGRAWRRD